MQVRPGPARASLAGRPGLPLSCQPQASHSAPVTTPFPHPLPHPRWRAGAGGRPDYAALRRAAGPATHKGRRYILIAARPPRARGGEGEGGGRFIVLTAQNIFNHFVSRNKRSCVLRCCRTPGRRPGPGRGVASQIARAAAIYRLAFQFRQRPPRRAPLPLNGTCSQPEGRCAPRGGWRS